MTGITKEQLASMIDHTILAPDALENDVKNICLEAIENSFCTVFVNPRWVKFAFDILKDTKVKVGSVVSFPLGAETTDIKVKQARRLVADGALEVDMVADIPSIIKQDRDYFLNELKSVVNACKKANPAVIVKVIIEAGLLNEEQMIFACKVAEDSGIDFVKTNTGMHKTGGAKPEYVRILSQHVKNCKIKASGGIKTAPQALELIEAGASRIGTSSSIQIIQQFLQDN